MIKFDHWRNMREDAENPSSDADPTTASTGSTSAPITDAESVPAADPAPVSANSTTPAVSKTAYKLKPWKAGKQEIMKFWKGIQTNLPFAMKPIEYDHKGTTIQEDGIRITGSKEFIASVISRLKDFLIYENPETKLMVSYRQSPKSLKPGARNSYSFYLQVKQRGKK